MHREPVQGGAGRSSAVPAAATPGSTLVRAGPWRRAVTRNGSESVAAYFARCVGDAAIDVLEQGRRLVPAAPRMETFSSRPLRASGQSGCKEVPSFEGEHPN